MADLKKWTRSFVGLAGAALAGPTGAIIGTFLGSIMASIFPGANDLSNQVMSNIGRLTVDRLKQRIDQSLTPKEKKQINHDLQTAFRDAVHEALLDIGGKECFPILENAPPRDVPIHVVFSLSAPGRTLWQRDNPLASQVQELMQTLDLALSSQTVFPLEPPSDQTSADVAVYLAADRPKDLEDHFFKNFEPIIRRFSTLNRELPELEHHLRLYLPERMLVHLGEHLKHRAPAWRAFNRMVLDNMQQDLSQVVTGQSEIMDRLNALSLTTSESEFNAWSDQIAEMITTAGSISIQLEEGFDQLCTRIVDHHQEVITHLEDLVSTSKRIEKKVDRVLRFLGDGKYTIDSEQLAIPIRKPPVPGEAPYMGLQYFNENDSQLFFGRDRWISRIFNRLQNTRFLAIIGASGSGKSSVVRAGVIPVLKNTKQIREVVYRPPNSASWPVYVITPTSHPLDSLAAIISSKNDLKHFRKTVKELLQDPHNLDLHLRSRAVQEKSEHIFLVVDQFEEVFTQCSSPEERKAFIQALMDAANPQETGILVLMIILRADFYASCAEFETLRSAISNHQEYIGTMTPEEIKQAILQPAELLGWKFEPGLPELIIQDAGQEPGMLPLLSHALLETWRNRSGNIMTLESYAESGGVKGAIAKTAEIVYNHHLTSDQQKIARNIFLRLTNFAEGVQETRRQSSLLELASNNGEVEKVVRLLANARLLSVEENVINVAHEALIREWPKLRGWLDENRTGLRIHNQLSSAAQEWQRYDHDEGFLYRGLRLHEAMEWAQENIELLNDIEKKYLETSTSLERQLEEEKQEQQKRELEAAQKLAAAQSQRAEEQIIASRELRRREHFLRLALIGSGALAVMAIIFALIASDSSQKAKKNADVAEISSTQAVAESYTRATAEAEAVSQSRLSQVREVAASARSLIDLNQDLALLLGCESVRLSNLYGGSGITNAQNALFNALSEANYATTLRGHSDTLNLISFSPDGQKVLTTSYDNSAMVWGLDGRRLAVLSGHKGPVISAVFSPDQSKILTSSTDHSARIWQNDGKFLQALEGHTGEVNQAVFSPDGGHILTVSADGTAILWDENGKNPFYLQGHTDSVLSGAFSPNSILVATSGADATIRLWDLKGSLLHTLTGHESWINTVQFSPDGKKILSSSWDSTAKLWDLEGKLIATLTGHKKPLNSALFSRDGNFIVTSATDNTARIWSSSGEFLVDLRGHTQQVSKAVFSPDNALVATASLDNTVRLWQMDGTLLSILRGHAGFVYDVAFSPDGKYLASAGSDVTGRIWERDQIIRILQDHYGATTTGAFFADGRIMTGSIDGKIRLWGKDGVKTNEFYANGPIEKAVISADGNHILVATVKKDVVMYTPDGEEELVLHGHQAKVVDAEFSTHGNRILTASQDGNAIIWDTSGEIIATLSGHSGPLSAAKFSADGKYILTASDDKTVRLWNADGSSTPILFTHPDAVSRASFNPENNRIITSCWDGNAYLWNVDGSLIATLSGHTGPVFSAEFSPGGAQILTSSYDASARLWSAEGILFSILEGHTSWLSSAVFDSDGSRILTTSWDGTARIYNGYAKNIQMISDAVTRVGRSLTPIECSTYLHLERCP